MKNHTAMPTIEFGEGTDYDALYSLLSLANKALGLGEGGGITYDFVLDSGRVITGTYLSDNHDEEDLLTIALHKHGEPTGETITVATDAIVKVVYL